MNVFLFLGCSFTWGEGLQYYSELPSVIFHSHHKYDIREITYPQYQFIRKNRFARIVADNLNAIEIVDAVNGGTNIKMLESLKKETEFKPNYSVFADEKTYLKESLYYKNEITHIVIQFTEILRDKFESCGAKEHWDREEQWKYCFEKNISTDEFEKDGIRWMLRRFKNKLEPYIESGVKFAFFSWKEINWMDIFNEDEFKFFKDNLLNIKYNDEIFHSIDELTDMGNRLTIGSDFCKKGYQCGDSHLSLDAHKIIAESIIEKFSN